ncbi:HAMP domain-containing sensor histidine kinase [Maricaulis sp.]|uniref:sensor histidine kinase n=1 Tax=Maricaulis sp. TaxID=1486257 RepID=UPI00262C0507|nr:HAMP domain-containing sensor histidine kinase [Maricaulis sp.]
MNANPSSDPGAAPGVLRRTARAFTGLFRALFESLPGQLLVIIVVMSALGLVLVYFPAMASHRLDWMERQVELAYRASLAADVAEDSGRIADMTVERLLGEQMIAVSFVRDGRNELVLYRGQVQANQVQTDLRKANWMDHLFDTVDTLWAPDGRILRIRAMPQGRADETIDLIIYERELKRALGAYSGRLLVYFTGVAVILGGAIYLAMFFRFVQPMRRLGGAMMHFRDDPGDPTRRIALSGSRNEIGRAEEELARMQGEIYQALQQRERLAALGEAVAKINHDLRNVLASAQLVSDRLAMDSDERVRKMGERLVRAVDRGVRLCQATLEYGRAEDIPPQRRPVQIRDLVEEAAEDARLSEGSVEWLNEVDAMIEIEADPDHAHRILLNLFRNAIQAMSAQAMNATGSPARLSASAQLQQGQLHIWVRDNGPGLPDKARANLFKAFTGSTRKGGTGLGLTIARELARGHGGDLVLVKTGDEGTVFGVILPVTAAEGAP